MVSRYGAGVLAWAVLVGLWFLFAVPADLVDAVIGLVVATGAVTFAARVAPTLDLRAVRFTASAATLATAVPGDVLTGSWRVLRGRWPGRRRVLPVAHGPVAGQGDRALVGLALSLGPGTYLLGDEPLQVHQLGRGAGAVAARLDP